MEVVVVCDWQRLTVSGRDRVSPWAFPVVYLGWAYLFWTVVVLSGESVWSFPNVVFFVVVGTSPVLAGVGLLWPVRGRAALVDLWQRLTAVARIDSRWWPVVLLLHPGLNLLIAGVAVLVGITDASLEVIAVDRLSDPIGLFGIVAFSLLLPLPEEVGLRGYRLDRLQVQFTALGGASCSG